MHDRDPDGTDIPVLIRDLTDAIDDLTRAMRNLASSNNQLSAAIADPDAERERMRRAKEARDRLAAWRTRKEDAPIP